MDSNLIWEVRLFMHLSAFRFRVAVAIICCIGAIPIGVQAQQEVADKIRLDKIFRTLRDRGFYVTVVKQQDVGQIPVPVYVDTSSFDLNTLNFSNLIQPLYFSEIEVNGKSLTFIRSSASDYRSRSDLFTKPLPSRSFSGALNKALTDLGESVGIAIMVSPFSYTTLETTMLNNASIPAGTLRQQLDSLVGAASGGGGGWQLTLLRDPDSKIRKAVIDVYLE